MPIKPPGAPDYHCQDCGHMFRVGVLKLLQSKLTGKYNLKNIKCPKCGSCKVSCLTY